MLEAPERLRSGRRLRWRDEQEKSGQEEKAYI